MKIYLDNNLGVTNVEQEELTQDTIGYNILKVYIPNAVLTPYDTFTCYYGALLQNGRKVGWFAMEARTNTDADYEANYTLYKATLEQCVVSVEGKVYIGCQVLLGNSGNATLIKKNTAVVQFNVRKSVAINNDILVLDTDQTTTDVLESYKNLLENALTTYATKAEVYTKAQVDALLLQKADKSDTYTKTEVDTINLNLAGQIAGARVELQNEINSTNNNVITTIARVTVLENDVADLKSVQNVVDIVPTKSALNSYDTSKLEENDKVQVIADETHDGASTIYNWSGSAWQYVGAYGTNSYTKQESDNKFATKTTAVTHTGNQLQDYSGNNVYPKINADSIPNGAVGYIKVDEEIKKIMQINNNYTFDLLDSVYWEKGAINVTSGNVTYGNRLRTRMFILLCDNDILLFDNSLDENIKYQIRYYDAPFISSDFSGACDEEVAVVTTGAYYSNYRVARIVINADNTSYTTIEQILAKSNIKLIRNCNEYEFNKKNGFTIPFSNLSWQDGGLGNQYSGSQYGVTYNGDGTYQASVKRNQNKIMVNPKSIYKFISFADNVYVKVWGYNSPVGSDVASIETYSFQMKECEITGYPYIRIVLYSLDLDTNTYIPITDLSSVIDKIFMVEIPFNYESKFQNQSKIRYGTFNVGHYAFGLSDQPSQNFSAITNYIKFFGSLNTDIMTFVEDNNHCFDASKTKDLYKNLYSIFFKWYDCGKQYSYNCNSVASFYPIIYAKEKAFTTATSGRYYLDTLVNINNKLVHIISVHLDWNSETYRMAQIQELIELTSNYEYFIISGDFNTLNSGVDATPDNIQPFKDAGYNVANGGNFGYIITAYDRDTQNAVYIDNIVTSPNIHICNASAIQTNLSDHYPLVADLIID